MDSMEEGLDAVAADVLQRMPDRSGHCSRRVWPAAHTLLECAVRRLPRGARVLELGAGTGYVGIVLATVRPDIELVCMSEMREGGALDNLRSIVEAVTPDHARARVTTAELDWRHPAFDQLPPFDAYIGSELVYSEETAMLACRLLAQLLRRCPARPVCLLSQTIGRWGAFGYDSALLNALRDSGLVALPIPADIDVESGTGPRLQYPLVFDLRLHDETGAVGSAARPLETELAAADRVLLSAVRAHHEREQRQRSAMTDAERAEMDAAELIAQLWL